MFDERAVAYTSIEVEAGGTCNYSLAWRAAKAAVGRVLDTGIGNKRKPRTYLVKGAYRVRAVMPDCNTVVGRPGWSSSHARLFVSL